MSDTYNITRIKALDEAVTSAEARIADKRAELKRLTDDIDYLIGVRNEFSCKKSEVVAEMSDTEIAECASN